MAFFGVTLETIDTVRTHPNADRLDLATVKGMTFQFVVGRDQWKAGDSVLYFPVDSVLPASVVEQLGLTGRLSGSDKNRIKTVRLRGEISQGLVADPVPFLGATFQEPELFMSSEGITGWTPELLTAHLGVTKYEPPLKYSRVGNLLPMPDGVGVYDIEGADRYPGVIDLLMDQPVCITEKLEGTNLWVRRLTDGTVQVGQRNYLIEEVPALDKANMYWDAVRECGVLPLLETAAARFPGQTITFRGELLGQSIQGYYKGLKENTIRFFDVQVDGHYLVFEAFIALIPPEQRVPVLFVGTLREWLGGRTIQETSNGDSVFSPGQKREGIVIRPMVERQILDEIPGFRGRLLIKQRSPEYLAGGDA